MTFIEKLRRAWEQQDSLLCIGIDPDPERIPSCVRGADGILDFNRAIIDATAVHACAFKPQIAFFAAQGAERILERTIDHIRNHHPHLPVILDAKRGDIGTTAEMYAREAFDRYGADAVTVNPYLGGDTIKPFLRYEDRGVIVLCRTSNAGSDEFQGLACDGESVSLRVARKAAGEWNRSGNVALVVGATWPGELAEIRALVGDMPLLVPGIGAQGGEIAAVVEAGIDSRGQGLIINSSRSVLYAGSDSRFAESAAAEAASLRERINRHRRIHDRGAA